VLASPPTPTRTASVYLLFTLFSPCACLRPATRSLVFLFYRELARFTCFTSIVICHSSSHSDPHCNFPASRSIVLFSFSLSPFVMSLVFSFPSPAPPNSVSLPPSRSLQSPGPEPQPQRVNHLPLGLYPNQGGHRLRSVSPSLFLALALPVTRFLLKPKRTDPFPSTHPLWAISVLCGRTDVRTIRPTPLYPRVLVIPYRQSPLWSEACFLLVSFSLSHTHSHILVCTRPSILTLYIEIRNLTRSLDALEPGTLALSPR